MKIEIEIGNIGGEDIENEIRDTYTRIPDDNIKYAEERHLQGKVLETVETVRLNNFFDPRLKSWATE